MDTLRIIRQTIRRCFLDNIPQSAAALSYFLLFSLFPFFIFLNSLLAKMRIAPDSLFPALRFLPKSLANLIMQYFTYINGIPATGMMVVGITLTIYFLSRAIRSLMKTVAHIYRTEVRRNVVMDVALSVLFTIGFLASILLSFILVVVGRTTLRIISTWLPAATDILNSVHNMGYPLVITFIFLFLLLFNKVVPNLRLTWKQALPGALFSLIAWLVISVGFSFYVDNMANYSVLYGSLGAIIVLMLWLYWMSTTLILGALVNHIILTHRKKKGRFK